VNQTTSQRVAKNSSLGWHLLEGSSWALGTRVAGAFLAVGLNALLARLLSPAELGAYFLVSSVVAVGVMIAQFGLPKAALRFVAEGLTAGRTDRVRATVRASLLAGLAGGALVGLSLNLGVGNFIANRVFDSPLMYGAMGVAALWVVVLSVQGILAEIFRGFHDIRWASVFGGPFTSLATVAILALIWAIGVPADLRSVVLVSALAVALSVGLALRLLRRKTLSLTSQPTQLDPRLFSVAGSLLLTNVTLFLLRQLDLWAIGMFRSEQEVAIYGAALRLVLQVAVPLLIVNAVVPPVISRLYTLGDIGRLESTLRTVTTFAALPAGAVLACFILFGGPILAFVYGEFYRQGALLLVILSFGQLINVFAGSCGVALNLTGHHRIALSIGLISSSLMAIGMFWAVGIYGPIGVAVASAAGSMLNNVLLVVAVKRHIGIWTHLQLAPSRIMAALRSWKGAYLP
jgi:O-antigen/teichoic acid export membrane protein